MSAVILEWKKSGAETTMRPSREPTTTPELVALAHIDLETVVSTVDTFRALGKGGLLDDFNGGRKVRQAATSTL